MWSVSNTMAIHSDHFIHNLLKLSKRHVHVCVCAGPWLPFVFISHHDFDMRTMQAKIISIRHQRSNAPRTHTTSGLYNVHFSHRWPPQSFRHFFFFSHSLKRRRETWLDCPMSAWNKWMKLVKFVYTKIKWPFCSGEKCVIAICGCRQHQRIALIVRRTDRCFV